MFKKKNKGQERSRVRNTGHEDPSNSSKFMYSSSRAEEDLSTGRRSEAERNKAANKGRSIWLQRFGTIILLAAIVVATLNILKITTPVNVEPVNSSEAALLLQKNDYANSANKIINSSVWNRNKITINTADIAKQLEAQYPEIAKVSVSLSLLTHTPIIYIQPAQLALVLNSADYGTYVIDQNGRALLKSSLDPILNGKTVLPVVTDSSGLTISTGQQVLPASDVTFIQIVSAELQAKGYTISSITLPPSASELDVALQGQPYIIKYNLENNDPQQQTGTFIATINQLQKNGTKPQKYVDVRLDGRAYYQ